MKKYFFLFLLILSVFLGTKYWFASPVITQNTRDESSRIAVRDSTPSETTTGSHATINSPKRLRIPSISVDAEIESVGMDAKGNMDVPKDSDNAAWYNLGYKPGENGSAVIDGHFDKESGDPAVFYKLSSLTKGDLIEVEQSNGEMLSFRVITSEEYNFDQLPLQKIFNSPGAPTLNLITCDGVFNKSAKNYSQRLVVYAELTN